MSWGSSPSPWATPWASRYVGALSVAAAPGPEVVPIAESGESREPSAVAAGATASPEEQPGVLFSLLLFALVCLAAPFLAGFENIIGLLIIAIGLYEAWKLNQRLVVNITGPFEVAPEETVQEPVAL